MTDQHLENKRAVHAWWQKLNGASLEESQQIFADMLTENTQWGISHPINDLSGADAVLQTYWLPLKRAMPDIRRDHYILMAGESQGNEWVSATGYYRGTFIEDWLGFPLTQRPIDMRFGEFLRFENGKIAQVYMMLDLVAVLKQAGYNVLPPSAGASGYVPGPITQDGVLLEPSDPAVTAAARELVRGMIFDGLLQYDQKTLASMNVRSYWKPDMIWYGPEGIGTTRTIVGFEDYHQRPFLKAFPDRMGGDHDASISDGPYVSTGGWPSLKATHQGDYLGYHATRKPVEMRVMDWWRMSDGLLHENWVLIDLPHLFLQMGKDLFIDFDMK